MGGQGFQLLSFAHYIMNPVPTDSPTDSGPANSTGRRAVGGPREEAQPHREARRGGAGGRHLLDSSCTPVTPCNSWPSPPFIQMQASEAALRSQLTQQLSPALDSTAAAMSAEISASVALEVDGLRNHVTDQSRASVSEALTSGLEQVGVELLFDYFPFLSLSYLIPL